MLSISESELRTLNMDHHGLVASVCKDLKIAEKIDQRIGVDDQRIVTPGQSVVAMILNGLGFTNRRLYLTHQFFKTKPIDRLLGAPIQAEDLTDHTLGHTLDEIWQYGATRLFGEVAFETALEHDLLGRLNHLDTTSLSVCGEYASEEAPVCAEKKGSASDDEQDMPQVIKLTHGHSKDCRPDLKQAVLSLVVNGPAGLPLWMEGLDGNSSDKTSFHETIKKVEAFQAQIDTGKQFRWVADSALYVKDKLLKDNGWIWLTRVPETISQARDLVELPDEQITWQVLENGYKLAELGSRYGGISQRWLLVFSSQAFERERKTLEKLLSTQEERLTKALWHLGCELFCCEQDAQSALKKIAKAHPLHDLHAQFVPEMKYAKRGKPKQGEEKIQAGYKLQCGFERNTAQIAKQLNRKGRFILATNDLNEVECPGPALLEDYKAQQTVEGGFRFLKDPWFMVDSIFLKSPKRIEALMMVMTLCLLVYNVAQYKLRKALQDQKDTLPNQLNKQVKNPTLRWIFQMMEGISIVRFYENNIGQPFREVIANLDAIRQKIIRLFGSTACQMYGLVICKNAVKGVGM